MSLFASKASGAGGSFLPEDYLQKKAERRQLAIGLALFLIVALAMVGAFFVTYRKWSTVMSMQAAVNREWVEQEKKIEQLKVLEAQRDELKARAETTTALLERVQRSTLLAELINRMPAQVTLTDLTLKSKRLLPQVKPQPAASSLAGPQTAASVGARATSAGTTPGAPAPAPKPGPPTFEFTLELSGLSATDEDVADYHAALVQCPLLDRVEMLFSGETTVQEVPMRKFRIEAKIRASADTRTIEPLHVPRLTGRPDPAARRPRPAADPMDPTLARPDDPNFDATRAQHGQNAD
jgi:Tfp pilus assembly protein PilN